MNESNAKIHLKIGELEFTIEGSSDYVSKQYKEMEKQLNLRKRVTGESETNISQKPSSKKRPRTSTKTTKKSMQSTTQSFDKWLEKLPKGTKNRDKVLVAGYFIQQSSKDKIFRVRDMNNVLKKHDIRTTNPSSLINNIVKSKKYIRQVTREGRQKYLQITEEGEKYIRDLLEANNK